MEDSRRSTACKRVCQEVVTTEEGERGSCGVGLEEEQVRVWGGGGGGVLEIWVWGIPRAVTSCTTGMPEIWFGGGDEGLAPTRRALDLAGFIRWPDALPNVRRAEEREERAPGERSPMCTWVSSA